MEVITFTVNTAELAYMVFIGKISFLTIITYAIFKYDLGEKFSLWR